MSNSTYYYNLYIQYDGYVSNYVKNIQDLQSIKSGIESTFFDEETAVNGELNDLISDLNESVRQNKRFNNNVQPLEEHKEKAATEDKMLSSAINCLAQEINALNIKKTSAEGNRNIYYNLYISEKAKEEKK